MMDWEDLRKQARKLENEIDLKLVSFSKLGTGTVNTYKNNESDTEPLLSTEHVFDSVAVEIEELLAKLTSVNEKLGEIASSEQGSGGGAAMLHTLQRHRDILQDYSQEFRKTQQNYRARRERENLLHSVKKDIDLHSLGVELDQVSSCNQDTFDLQPPDLSDSEFQYVEITFVEHPGDFFFQPIKYRKELKKLQGQMAAYYNAGALPELSAERVVKNKIFAARRDTDNFWFRVVVTGAPVGGQVPICLCDYGEVLSLPISNLRELAREFHAPPFLAVKGHLAGVVPRQKDWTEEDCDRFQCLVFDKILDAKIIKIRENGEIPMDMLVTMDLKFESRHGDQDIGEILTKENRAVREN